MKRIADPPAATATKKVGGFEKLLHTLEEVLGVEPPAEDESAPKLSGSVKGDGKGGGTADLAYKAGAVTGDAQATGDLVKGRPANLGGSLSGAYAPANGPFSADGKVAVDGNGVAISEDAKYKSGGLTASESASDDHGAISANGAVSYAAKNGLTTGVTDKYDAKGNVLSGTVKYDGDGPFTGNASVSDDHGVIKTTGELDYDSGKGLTSGLTESSDGSGVDLDATAAYEHKNFKASGEVEDDHGAISTKESVGYDNKKGDSVSLDGTTDSSGYDVNGSAHYKSGGLTASATGSDKNGSVTSTADVAYANKKGFSSDVKETTDDKGANVSGNATYTSGGLTATFAGTDDHGKITSSADVAYKDKHGLSTDVTEKTDSKGYSVTGGAKLDKKKVNASVGGGVDHGTAASNADVAFNNQHGFQMSLDESSTNDKVAFGGSLKETSRSGDFAASLDAKVDQKGDVSAGGSIHIADKRKDSLDFAASVGPKGLQASATLKIKNFKIGVVMRNTSIVTLTLDLGPKHPQLNEIINLALTAASISAAPVPFAIGTAFRLLRGLFKHNPFHRHHKAAAAAAPAAAATGGNEPVAILMPDELEALTAAGAIHDSGALNVGLDPELFNSALMAANLDGEQHRALLEVWAGSDAFLPAGDAPADPARGVSAAAADPSENVA